MFLSINICILPVLSEAIVWYIYKDTHQHVASYTFIYQQVDPEKKTEGIDNLRGKRNVSILSLMDDDAHYTTCIFNRCANCNPIVRNRVKIAFTYSHPG